MLRAPHVTGFVLRHAHQLSPVRAGLMVTALRSFLRYLRHCGAIATDLAGCVPTVPNWSLSTLPRFLPAAMMERMLERCDRRRPLAGGTMPSCCCSPDSAYVPAKSLG